MEILVIIATESCKTNAVRMAKLLIKEKLAACVSIKQILSVYEWDDDIQETIEFEITIKSKPEFKDYLIELLNKISTYDVPQIIYKKYDSEMKYLYETEELLKFVSACLGVSPIFRWADPLACHAYNVMKPDGVLPWHFDSCEFTLSLMIQKPEKGGVFEYCPNIREPGNENFEEVQKVIAGDRTRVRQLKLEPGDLQIFKGR